MNVGVLRWPHTRDLGAGVCGETPGVLRGHGLLWEQWTNLDAHFVGEMNVLDVEMVDGMV